MTSDKPKDPSAITQIAYLVSRYPAVSHTFILNEVIRLRGLGIEIKTASINNPDRSPATMTSSERLEHEGTYYVKQHGVTGAVAALFWQFKTPSRLFTALTKAIALGGANPRKTMLMLFYLVEAMMISRWMAKNELTHLHVHFASQAATVGLLLKHISSYGYSLTVHGPDEFYNVNEQHLKQKLIAADFVVCISAFARSQLMFLSDASHWHKFIVCRLGIDPTKFKPTNRSNRTSRSNLFRVLCVGRLVSAKGQLILIQACKELIEQHQYVRLVIVGSGPDMSTLKAYVSQLALDDYVIFTGALNHDQIVDEYANAHAFVLASFAEGIPVVLMEAMASGVPVVSTRITGVAELIQDNQDGLLVSPSDVSELSAALGSLMDDPQRGARFTHSARQKVMLKFNLDQNVNELANIFRLNVANSHLKRPAKDF